MAYPDNLLSRGEQVVLHKHPSWKVLVLPILAFILVVGGGSALAAWVGHWEDRGFTSHPQWYIGIAAVGVILLVWWVLVPFLRWGTEHFVVSTGHVFFRTGILRRREHQIPLARIQNMETEVTFWGRIFGFGSLIVESAADQPLEFDNVASLPKVQATLNQLISDDRHGAPRESSAGDGSAGQYTAPPAETRVDSRDRQEYAPRDHAATEQYEDYAGQGSAEYADERATYADERDGRAVDPAAPTEVLGPDDHGRRNVHDRRGGRDPRRP